MIALIHIKKTAGKTFKHIMRCEFGVAHCDVKRWRPLADVFSAFDPARMPAGEFSKAARNLDEMRYLEAIKRLSGDIIDPE